MIQIPKEQLCWIEDMRHSDFHGVCLSQQKNEWRYELSCRLAIAPRIDRTRKAVIGHGTGPKQGGLSVGLPNGQFIPCRGFRDLLRPTA